MGGPSGRGIAVGRRGVRIGIVRLKSRRTGTDFWNPGRFFVEPFWRRRSQLGPGQHQDAAKALMMSCASVAIAAAAIAPQQVSAQAFNGTPGGDGANVASLGSATRTLATNSELITIGTTKAVIDWSANDGSQ